MISILAFITQRMPRKKAKNKKNKRRRNKIKIKALFVFMKNPVLI